MKTTELITDEQTLIGAKTAGGYYIRVYDDGYGPLWISRNSIGINGIVRAQTWEDAYGICEDEFFPEADETLEEIIAEYVFKEEGKMLICRRHDVHTEWKFAESADYPLNKNGWEFARWCYLLTLDREAWVDNARFQDAYGFRPSGPNAADKLNHGIYSKDLNGDYLDRLTTELLAELGITLQIDTGE